MQSQQKRYLRGNVVKEMQPRPSESELAELASSLCSLRDSLMEVSIALKDHLANASSPAMMEIELQVSSALSQIREKAINHDPNFGQQNR